MARNVSQLALRLSIPARAAALVLDLRIKIAWALRWLSEAYVKHFQVISLGVENKSAFLEFLSAESRHSFAINGCKTFESLPVELTVIKVTLADGTIVFHLTCQGKYFCQMCQRDIKKMSMPLGAAVAVTMMNILVSQEFIFDYGYLLKSRGPWQQRLNSGSPPACWFPLPDAVVETWVAINLPPCSQFSDVPCAALGVRLTLKVDTTVCNCSVRQIHARMLCFAKCTTQFSVCGQIHRKCCATRLLEALAQVQRL